LVPATVGRSGISRSTRNQAGLDDDYLGMNCAQMRAAISAELDGEERVVAPPVLARHLAGCQACRDFQAAAMALNGRVRVSAAPAVPDLTGRVVAAIDRERERSEPASAVQGLRLGLVVIGLIQLGLSAPALALGSDAGLPVHQARHLGSFGAALAIGFIVAAWRPQRIAGLLPLATALVVCLVGSAIADVATGHAATGGEVPHVVEVLGLLSLWLLERVQPRSEPPRRRLSELRGV
jgi:predicted anti-sigma-YlaC factor YlaD